MRLSLIPPSSTDVNKWGSGYTSQLMDVKIICLGCSVSKAFRKPVSSDQENLYY